MQIKDLYSMCDFIISHPQSPDALHHQSTLNAFVGNPANLDECLQALTSNQNFFLVACSLLLKAIKGKKYTSQLPNWIEKQIEAQTEEQRVQYKQKIESVKLNVYKKMIQIFMNVLLHTRCNEFLPANINFMKDIVSLSLKTLLDFPEDIVHLQWFLALSLPNMRLPEEYTEALRPKQVVFEPENLQLPGSLLIVLDILKSVLDEINDYPGYASYYEFRRHINTFRSNFLPWCLGVSVYYLKIMFLRLRNGQNVSGLFLYLSKCLTLLESITNYPFRLNMEEFQYEPEARQHTSSQIYFPSYFRNVTRDHSLLNNIFQVYLALASDSSVSQTNKQEQMSNILRIFSRLFGASCYYFESDNQRKQFRYLAIRISVSIADTFKNIHGSYYTTSALGLVDRILTTYNKDDFSDTFLQFARAHLQMLSSVIQFSDIEPQLRENNPICRAFSLIKKIQSQFRLQNIITFGGDSADEALFKAEAQKVLQIFMVRLATPGNFVDLQEFVFKNYKKQAKHFHQMFKPLYPVFEYESQKNLQHIASLSLSKVPARTLRSWVYFITSMSLQVETHKKQHAEVILTVFQFARNSSESCFLNFLDTLVRVLLREMQNGVSATVLWFYIKNITEESFCNFMTFVIEKCIQIFSSVDNQDLIDYSLQMLNYIYEQIKKHQKDYQEQNFESYYKLFQDFTVNLNQTCFNMVKYYKKRVKVFKSVACLWVDNNEPPFIYSVYGNIRRSLEESADGIHPWSNFLKYLYDTTGLIQQIQTGDTYQIITQLIINDFPILYTKWLNEQIVVKFLSDKTTRKAVIKFCLAIVDDRNRRLSESYRKIHVLIDRYIKPIARVCCNFPYSKTLLIVMYQLAQLNPFGNLVPLPSDSELTDPLDIEAHRQLTQLYFDNLCRIQNLADMYKFAKQNPEYLLEWWDELVSREIQDFQIPDFKAAFEAKIWKTKKQHECMGRVLMIAGQYSKKYQIYPELLCAQNETDFVKKFILKTRDRDNN